MKISRLLPLFAGLLSLGACAMPWQVAEVQDAQSLVASVGSPFTKALTEEYKTQARVESEVESEWLHALIFAHKASRAAEGEVFLPEDPTTWEIPADSMKTLTDARARLLTDFDTGARDRLPALAAKAQAALDCWIEEEWEGEVESSCKKDFLSTQPQLAPPLPPAPPIVKLKVVKTFVVYFAFDKADLSDQARKVLTDIAAAQTEIKPHRIAVSGFTDTMGSADYNQKLSDHRAQTVAEALAGLGVGAVLEPAGYGKTRLAIPTKNRVKEAKNRRVEVYFESPE
jgi:OmpA-OmpF porin, OOP family